MWKRSSIKRNKRPFKSKCSEVRVQKLWYFFFFPYFKDAIALSKWCAAAVGKNIQRKMYVLIFLLTSGTMWYSFTTDKLVMLFLFIIVHCDRIQSWIKITETLKTRWLHCVLAAIHHSEIAHLPYCRYVASKCLFNPIGMLKFTFLQLNPNPILTNYILLEMPKTSKYIFYHFFFLSQQ